MFTNQLALCRSSRDWDLIHPPRTQCTSEVSSALKSPECVWGGGGVLSSPPSRHLLQATRKAPQIRALAKAQAPSTVIQIGIYEPGRAELGTTKTRQPTWSPALNPGAKLSSSSRQLPSVSSRRRAHGSDSVGSEER